jgi:hypothetical protein
MLFFRPAGNISMAKKLLLFATVLLALASLLHFLRWKENRDTLLQLLETVEPAELRASAISKIRYEHDRHHARILAARALVNGVLQLAPELRTAESGLARKHLAEAEKLSTEALRAQPNSWQAAMLVGTARYLAWSIDRDRRLVEQAAAWEEPLRWAVESTGGKAEPRRLLAAAYLETWWALSPDKRRQARELLAEVFRQDERAYRQLVLQWFEAAGSRNEGFELIPPNPSAWAHLHSIFRQAKDWPAVAAVRWRHLDALEQDLDLRLAETERRFALGDIEGGRNLCLEILAASPPQERFAPFVERALALYRPGLNRLPSTAPLGAWMHFLLRLDLVEQEPLLSQGALNRLNDLLDNLEPPGRLHAALLGQDVPRLREIHRFVESTRVWTPFLLAQARLRLQAERPAEARAILEQAAPISKTELPWIRLRARVAAEEDDPEQAAVAEEALARHRKTAWNALDWSTGDGPSSLYLLPERAGSGLRIWLADGPVQGGVLELLWDGQLIAVRTVAPSDRLDLDFPVTPEMHLLEIRSLAGERALPGSVQLLD